MVDVVLVVDDSALTQLRPVIRHLCVGLVDLSARVRVLTSSEAGRPLGQLGPVELLVHQELNWPFRKNRFKRIVDFLTPRPPNVIYGISAGSYGLTNDLADCLDIDYVVQVTSRTDVVEVERLGRDRLGHVIAASEPLMSMCRSQAMVSESLLTRVRPGVLRGSENTCFDGALETPTALCTTPLRSDCEIEVLIEALSIVRDRGLMLLLFLIGEGPYESGLRKLVVERKLTDVVTFARPTADATKIMRAADMFVLAPGDDHVAARPLQAMASGTVVVCFADGVDDFLLPGDTAETCEKPTAEALASAFEALLKDRQRAREIADRARAYVKAHHTMSGMAETTMDVLKRVVNKHRNIPIGR